MRRWLTILSLGCVSVTHAQQPTSAMLSLHAPSESPAHADVTVDLVVMNPDNQSMSFTPPAELRGTLRNDQRNWVVTLRPAKPTAPVTILPRQFVNVPYVLNLPGDVTGRIALEVSQVPSLQIAMDVHQGESPKVSSGESKMNSLKQQEANAPPAMSGIERAFANRFGLQEPIYFLYGPEAPSVKFQFSFKYRLIGENGKFGDLIPPFRGLYFAYTQRSLWDTGADSSPFYDTSYMPELFFEWLAPQNGIAGGGFHWLGMQTGVGHESNGKDGVDSRSMNTAYLRAAMMFGVAESWRLLVVPRVFSYLDTGDENADIADYRGYGELQLAFGKNDSVQLGAATRIGTSGKGSFQVDLTQPVRIPVINLQTYLQLQYFDGYGESLRTYSQKSSIWRLGLAFAR